MVLLGVAAFQVVRTGLALRAAEASSTELRESLAARDLDAASVHAEDLATQARQARESSDGLLWSAAARLPVIGDDVGAVSAVALALDEVASVAPEGLQTLEAAAAGQIRTPDGGVDLAVVRSLAPQVTRADEAVGRAQRALDGVDPATLVAPLAGRTEEFSAQVRRLGAVLGGAEVAVRLLPGMLGADGPRDYLLVVQNNAEVRATGGLPGSASVLRARDGRLRLGEQGSAGDAQGDPAQLDLQAEPGELETFGPQLLTDFRNANFTPDFPRAAELMAASAEDALGRELDGVVTVDPITLAQVLRSSGPVEVAGEQIDADNAVRMLLFEPYQNLDPVAQDAYFEVAAGAILDALLSADGDQLELVEVLAEAVQQRRLLFWTRDEEAQSVLADSAVSGDLPEDTGRPEIGMYLNDGTMAKMQYFLRYDAQVESLGCDDQGRQLVRAEMELTTDVTEPVDQLADSVTGYGQAVPRGETLLVMRILAPEGGELRGVQVDGAGAEGVQTEVYGREATGLEIELGPQQTRRVTAVLATAPGDTGDPRLQWTPGMQWEPTSQTAESRCAAGSDPAAVGDVDR